VPRSIRPPGTRTPLLTFLAESKDSVGNYSLPEAFRAMNSPAEKLELPVEGEATYSPSNREQAIPLLEKYAVRFLSPDEVAEQMPLYFATLNKTPQK
jgi:hypothetical protein